MTYTKKTPTTRGAYWWRECENEDPSLFRVMNCHRDGAEVVYVADLVSNGEWCGPLVPASEVERAYVEGYKHGEEPLSGLTYHDTRARRIAEGDEA